MDRKERDSRIEIGYQKRSISHKKRRRPKGRIVKLRRINTPLLFVGKKTWGVKLKRGSHTSSSIW
jgi:hypothetical protein